MILFFLTEQREMQGFAFEVCESIYSRQHHIHQFARNNYDLFDS